MREISTDNFSENLSEDNIYFVAQGKLGLSNTLYGFVRRKEFDDGKFEVCAINSLFTKGNGWSFSHKTLVGVIEILLKTKFSIFEFKTIEEAFSWYLQVSFECRER